MQNECEYCGKLFDAKRADARTCSDKCRIGLHRQKDAEHPIEPPSKVQMDATVTQLIVSQFNTNNKNNRVWPAGSSLDQRIAFMEKHGITEDYVPPKP